MFWALEFGGYCLLGWSLDSLDLGPAFPFEFNYCIGCGFFDIKLTAMPKILLIARLTQWDLRPCWAWYLMPQQVDQALRSQVHKRKYF